MKKSPVFIIMIVFIAAFVYLNQKIHIYVQAYKLSKAYSCYNNLSDKRDYLIAALAPKISVSKVNQWAQNNKFSPVEKERVLALNLRPVSAKSVNQSQGMLNQVIPAVEAKTVKE